MEGMNRIWKMYIFFSFVVILAMALTGFALQGLLKKRLYSHVEDDVLILAKTIAKALPDSDDSAVLASWCDDYAKVTAMRITVMDEEGKVLCDSEEGRIVGFDHVNRPEVMKAMEQGTAMEVRYSATSGTEMLYAALFSHDKRKIIRLSLPMTKVKSVENEVMAFFVLAIYLAPLLAVVIAFFFVKRVAMESDSRRYKRVSGHAENRSC